MGRVGRRAITKHLWLLHNPRTLLPAGASRRSAHLVKARARRVNIGSKVAETGQGNTSAMPLPTVGLQCAYPRMGGGTAEIRHPGERGDRC